MNTVEIQEEDYENLPFTAKQIVMKYNKFKLNNQYWNKDEILKKQEEILNIFLDKNDEYSNYLDNKNAYGKLFLKLTFLFFDRS